MVNITSDLVLSNDHWRVGVRPAVGAALTFGQVLSPAGALDLLRPTPFLGRVTGSYPLIPWSNRIGGGVLEMAGKRYQLRLDDDAGQTAIHAVVRDYPWTVLASDQASCQLGFDSRSLTGVNWPWAFGAKITYRLDGPRFETVTELTNLDSVAWPAGLGHHPYFNRRLSASPADEVQVQINCGESFELVDCLAVGPPGPVPPELDFRTARGFGDKVALDDCLTGRTASPNEPVATLTYPESGLKVQVRADPLFACMVLYAPQGGAGLFALEPVTNCNDGFALAAKGVAGTGVFQLEPDQRVQATWSMTVGSTA